MFDLTTIILIVCIHTLSDFILQTNKMATNKGTSNFWLTFHVVVYTIPWITIGWLYALVNGILHWITDWITSRINRRSLSRGSNKGFFVGVGIDQAIHYITLFTTYHWLFG